MKRFVGTDFAVAGGDNTVFVKGILKNGVYIIKSIVVEDLNGKRL